MPNRCSEAELEEKLCFANALKWLVEALDPRSLGSNHYGYERDGVYVIKCTKARCYWFPHPKFEDNVCLVHFVAQGKTRQWDDIEEAVRRKKIAEKIDEISE